MKKLKVGKIKIYFYEGKVSSIWINDISAACVKHKKKKKRKSK